MSQYNIDTILLFLLILEDFLKRFHLISLWKLPHLARRINVSSFDTFLILWLNNVTWFYGLKLISVSLFLLASSFQVESTNRRGMTPKFITVIKLFMLPDGCHFIIPTPAPHHFPYRLTPPDGRHVVCILKCICKLKTLRASTGNALDWYFRFQKWIFTWSLNTSPSYHFLSLV